MAEGYTYEELVKMGAKPGGYTYDEAVAAGAKPVSAPTESLAQRQAASKAAFDEANQQPWYTRFISETAQNSPLNQGMEKGNEQLQYVNEGIVHGIPNAILGMSGAVNRTLRHPATVLTEASNMARGITDPLTTIGKQAVELAAPGLVDAPSPDDPRTRASAEAAGANLAMVAAPSIVKATVPPVIKSAASKFFTEMTPKARANSLATITESAVKNKGVAPQEVAADAQPRLKQAYHEFGLDPQKIPTKDLSPGTDTVGDVIRGGTAADLAKVNQVLEAEHAASGAETPYRPAKSVTIAAADRMVDVAHRPIGETMKAFGQVEVPAVKQAVVDSLRRSAAENSGVNPKLARAYEGAARQIEAAGNTVGDMNALKVQANKAPSKLFTGSPSQQIAADANPIIAQSDMASLIREHLYPAVEDIGTMNGQPMAGKLIEAGRREANAILVRDGLYDNWSRAAGEHAPASLESYLHYVVRGGGQSVPIIGTPFGRPSAVNMGVRALVGTPKPMSVFNGFLRNGIGSLKDFRPEMVDVQPVRQIGPGYGMMGSSLNVTATPNPGMPGGVKLLDQPAMNVQAGLRVPPSGPVGGYPMAEVPGFRKQIPQEVSARQLNPGAVESGPGQPYMTPEASSLGRGITLFDQLKAREATAKVAANNMKEWASSVRDVQDRPRGESRMSVKDWIKENAAGKLFTEEMLKKANQPGIDLRLKEGPLADFPESHARLAEVIEAGLSGKKLGPVAAPLYERIKKAFAEDLEAQRPVVQPKTSGSPSGSASGSPAYWKQRFFSHRSRWKS